MSQTKYAVGGKAQLQDPEAILSAGSCIENEEIPFNSASNGAEGIIGVTDTCCENESETNNSRKSEYPTVTINGKATLESKESTKNVPSSLIRSKGHAFSEPDLTQANLYGNPKDFNSPIHITYQKAHQRKVRQKIGIGRGKKIEDIKFLQEKDNLKVDEGTKYVPASLLKGDSSEKSSVNMRYNRIFKKTSQDGNLVLFLPQRELSVNEEGVEPLMGVALIHESVIKKTDMKVFLQIVLIFRYGRDDEELLGLRFCNEVVIAADQIHPPPDRQDDTEKSSTKKSGEVPSKHSPSDEAFSKTELSNKNIQNNESSVKPTNQKVHPTVLANAQGFIAIPFVVNIGTSAPPSVRLIPCRPYSGAPIGTTYEVQLFTGTHPEEIPTTRRKMVSMSLRIMESLPRELPPKSDVFLEKRSLISGISGNDFALVIRAQLDSAVYTENDKILIRLMITKRRQRSSKSAEEDEESGRTVNGHGVRKIKITAVQQVGIALFSSGNFKNCLGNVVIKSDNTHSARNSISHMSAHAPDPNIVGGNKPSLNVPKASRRRYSLMPLPSIFRSHSAHSSKENTEGGTDSADLPSETKPSTNFSAFRTLMTSKGRKNSDGSDAREAVYAARPMTKGGRRYSCMPQEHRTASPEKNILCEQKRDSKDDADDEDKNVLTDFSLEPSEETFSEDIPLKIALEKDYSWAAMDDTSKKLSELTHLAPTVYHANKALFIVRVSYFVQVVVFYGLLKRSVTLKLPFILARPNPDTLTSSNNHEDQKGMDKSRIEEKNILEVPEEKNQTNSCEGMSNTNKKEDKKSKV